MSRPARGAWIEISMRHTNNQVLLPVAPRKGRVD